MPYYWIGDSQRIALIDQEHGSVIGSVWYANEGECRAAGFSKDNMEFLMPIFVSYGSSEPQLFLHPHYAYKWMIDMFSLRVPPFPKLFFDNELPPLPDYDYVLEPTIKGQRLIDPRTSMFLIQLSNRQVMGEVTIVEQGGMVVAYSVSFAGHRAMFTEWSRALAWFTDTLHLAVVPINFDGLVGVIGEAPSLN
jgi:hypothetical protein